MTFLLSSSLHHPSQRLSAKASQTPCIYVPGDDILVLPAELVTQTTDGAVLAAGLQPEDAESLGNDDALHVVVGLRDTLEGLKTLHGGGATGGLVGNHAADGAPEHLGGSAEVEGA